MGVSLTGVFTVEFKHFLFKVKCFSFHPALSIHISFMQEEIVEEWVLSMLAVPQFARGEGLRAQERRTCSHTLPRQWLTAPLGHVCNFSSPEENAQVAIKIWVRLDKPINVWNYSEVLIEVGERSSYSGMEMRFWHLRKCHWEKSCCHRYDSPTAVPDRCLLWLLRSR